MRRKYIEQQRNHTTFDNRARRLRQRNEKKKRAAIAAVGSDVTPRYRKIKRVTRNERLNAAGNTKTERALQREAFNRAMRFMRKALPCKSRT